VKCTVESREEVVTIKQNFSILKRLLDNTAVHQSKLSTNMLLTKSQWRHTLTEGEQKSHNLFTDTEKAFDKIQHLL
jgi:hypothetical protein